jgi:hypothetical protein
MTYALALSAILLPVLALAGRVAYLRHRAARLRDEAWWVKRALARAEDAAWRAHLRRTVERLEADAAAVDAEAARLTRPWGEG